MKISKIKIIQLILILMIAATLIFTFVQSTKSPEKSSADSDAVGGWVGEIIPPQTPVGGFVQINLRKIAHFTEFAVLGFETALYMILFCRKPNPILLTYPLSVIVAFFDETIQIFSGRGPSVSDMWIDVSGFVCLSLLTYAVFFGSRALWRTIKNKKAGKNG